MFLFLFHPYNTFRSLINTGGFPCNSVCRLTIYSPNKRRLHSSKLVNPRTLKGSSMFQKPNYRLISAEQWLFFNILFGLVTSKTDENKELYSRFRSTRSNNETESNFFRPHTKCLIYSSVKFTPNKTLITCFIFTPA